MKPSILRRWWSIVCLAATLAIPTSAWSQGVDDIRQSFERPPDDARIMMRWWWFGPAVTKPELEREMRVMRDGGIGGFEVQPTYPLSLDDESKGIRNLRYLSPEFLDALRFTGEKARELGLRMDLTLGSGWPYGGPSVTQDHAARKALPDGTPGYTKQQVKRPGFGAEGPVMDHYNREALDQYLKDVGEPMLKALRATPPYAIFCDSLEVYGADWTADFLEAFQSKRGYDLKPHLPPLFSSTVMEKDLPARIDWGRTLTELFNERFVAPLSDWAHKNGTRLRIQAYGIPPATISSYALADLPEGEGVQWKSLSATRWASSAGHLLGRPVISSETWTWLHSPVFRATPLDMKAEADLHFLQGINQLIGHGWPYTPESVEYPGWRFYAAAVFDEKNPWWIVMPDIALYLQRVSFLLRQGQPANDVAVYLPTADTYARFAPGRVDLFRTAAERVGGVVARILESGYGLDFFDDGALGKALQPGRYRIIVLPAVEKIPLDTLLRLEKYEKEGGIVLAIRRVPSGAPGFQATEAENTQVREAAARMFTGDRLVSEGQLGEVLRSHLRPDVEFRQPAPDIGFVHRSLPAGNLYFLANTGPFRQRVQATFRVGNADAQFWNPLTGEISPAVVRMRQPDATTTVDLTLEPYGSTVVAFVAPSEERPVPAPSLPSPEPIDLSKDWRVTFRETDAPLALQLLQSWTEREESRFFSGVATYEKDVEISGDWLRGHAVLDFGEGRLGARTPGMGYKTILDAPVREAAVVYVNGQRAGSIWCPPYRVDVSRLLREGSNTIQVKVANLAVNYMAGHPLPDYKALTAKYGERFQAQDMDKIKPEPAGLLGPIRLIVGERP